MARNHNITIEYEWVKNHQDIKPLKTINDKSLPITKAALINIYYDKRATKFMNKPTSRPSKNNLLISEDTRAYLKRKLAS